MIGDLTIGAYKQRHNVIKPLTLWSVDSPPYPMSLHKLQLPYQQNAHNSPIYQICTHYLASLASGLYEI